MIQDTAQPATVSRPTDLDEGRQLVARLAAVKSRGDIAAALELYHPEAELLCPPWGSASRGRTEIRKGLEAFYRLVPDYGVTLERCATAGDTLCAWGRIAMTLTATFRGDRPNGHRVSTPVFILFRFRDRRIAWESFHFDLADVARQSGVPAEAFGR